MTSDVPLVDAQNPWPGLTAFSEELSGYFYGRVEETDELVRRVRRNPLTVLFGKSGLGKTSLLQAGLAPRLRAEGMVPVFIRIDYGDDAPPPTAQVNAAVAEALRPLVRSGTPLSGPADSLWEYFHRREVTLVDSSGKAFTPVLIFDQFEELFTLSPASENGRARGRALVTALAELIENRPPEALEQRLETDPDAVDNFEFDGRHYGVLLSLREDYLANLQSFRREIPSVGQYGMRLTGMNGRQALAAVVEPGRDLVTPAVARKIVQNVAGAARGAGDGGHTDPTDLASFEVEPSLLSLVCRELNNRRLAAKLPQISAEMLAESRDAILRKFYDDSLAGQPEGVRQFVEDELLNESGFRESVSLQKARKAIAARGGAPDALDQLVSRRLLHVEERLGAQRVEITHDVLTKIIAQSRAERQEREAAVAAAEREEALQRQVRASRRRTILFSAGLGGGLVVALGGALWINAERKALDQQSGLIVGYVDDAGTGLRANRYEPFATLYGKWLERTTRFVGQLSAVQKNAVAANLQAVITANEADAKREIAEGARDSALKRRYYVEARAKADSAFMMGRAVARKWHDAAAQKGAAIAIGTTGLTWKTLGQDDTALMVIDTGIAVARAIPRRADSSADAFEAIFHRIRSDILLERGKPGDSTQALRSLETAVRLLSPLPSAYGDRVPRDELAFTLETLGWLQAHFGLLSPAAATSDSAIKVRKVLIDSLARAGPAARADLNEQQRRLAGTYLDRTYLQWRQKDTTAELASYDAARRLVEPLVKDDSPARFKKTLERALSGTTGIQLARSRGVADSIRLLPGLKTIASLAHAVYEASDDPGEWEDWASASYQLGQVQLSAGERADALKSYQDRIRALTRILGRRGIGAMGSRLANAYGGLAYMQVLNNRPDSALAAAGLGIGFDSTRVFIWTNAIDAYLLKRDGVRAENLLRARGCQNMNTPPSYLSLAQAMLDDDMKRFERFGLNNVESRRFWALAKAVAATCRPRR